MSERAPEGVYVYQPHPVSRKDGLLWSIGGLPSGMSREHATEIAHAVNVILSRPSPNAEVGSGNQVTEAERADGTSRSAAQKS